MNSQSNLKQQLHDHWNKGSCGTDVASGQKFSRDYFEQIESDRYSKEPEIFQFAQFTRAHGKKVLEVGVGAGTDFMQWCRAGALAYGIDLTEEAIANVEHRLFVYGLSAQEIKVADSESLPYPDNMFDLAYSWGVIQHTPDTPRALSEIVRVLKPGGSGKVMIYNRHSVKALTLWLRFSLLSGKPWRSPSWVLRHHLETPSSKGFTFREAKALFSGLPVSHLSIQSPLTYYDRSNADHSVPTRLMRACARFGTIVLRWQNPGWFMFIEFRKI